MIVTDGKPVGCLNRRHAAEYLSISVRLLDKLATAGEIPRVKIGSKTLFRKADLDQYVSGQDCEAAMTYASRRAQGQKAEEHSCAICGEATKFWRYLSLVDERQPACIECAKHLTKNPASRAE